MGSQQGADPHSGLLPLPIPFHCEGGALPLGAVPTGQGPVMGSTPGCAVVLPGATGVEPDGGFGF